VPRKDTITPFVCDGVISDLRIVPAHIWGWTLTWVNMTTAVGVGSAWNPHWTSHQILYAKDFRQKLPRATVCGQARPAEVTALFKRLRPDEVTSARDQGQQVRYVDDYRIPDLRNKDPQWGIKSMCVGVLPSYETHLGLVPSL
jgi:hypothetical protein